MAPSLSILSSVQIFMDSTFYGCFIMLFTVSIVVLNKRYHTLKTQSRRFADKEDHTKAEKKELRFWKMLGTTMIVLTTCHWTFGWVEVMAEVDDVKLRSRMSFMRFLFEMLNVIVGDALMLSRLWTIGGKNLIVVAYPLLCLVGFAACSARLAVLEAKHLLFFIPTPPGIQRWFTATTALTTSLNLYSTAYIAWKAWSANQLLHRSLYSCFMHISSIIVESAAIYAIWTCILLGIVVKDRTLWSFLLPVSPSLFGCTMMLISVRLGLGWALGLGGQAAKQPKSLVIQFARSENFESDMSDMEYNYRD